jgi:glycosyltransferase involved in cell wall biosynthesis
MKVLQVIPVFNPPELYGGSQQVVYQVSKGLVKRGHKVIVYTSDARRYRLKYRVNKSVEEIDGIKVFHFRNIMPYLAEKFGLVVTPNFKNVLENDGRTFDVIHVHEVRGYQHIVVHKFAKKFGVPYIVQAHGILGERSGLFRKVYDHFYLRKLLNDAAACIALNEYEVNQYKQMGVSEDKIVVVPNGINLSEYTNLPMYGTFRRKFGIPEETKILLYIGRIHKTKGLDILVRAFADFAKNFSDVKLVIAGLDDGFLRELKCLIKVLGLEEKAVFVGPLHGKAKLEAYVDSDVVVLPSRYEAFGMTVLEAYACGKPVIASEVGGLKDLIINGETGLLFEPENVNELSRAILTIVSGCNAKIMGSKARAFVRQFSIEKTVIRLEQLYQVCS